MGSGRFALIVVLWFAAVFAAAAQMRPAATATDLAWTEPLDVLEAFAASTVEGDPAATDPPGGDLSALRAPEPFSPPAPAPGGHWRQTVASATEAPWQDSLWRPPSRAPFHRG